MRVVIVEDNAIYKEELINCLNQEAEAVDIVEITDNGAEGLAVIEKVRPDVVFTDIRMPEMDGFEMIEAIRRKHIFCKFVVVSSCPEFVYAKRAMQLGVSDYLLKPVEVEKLQEAVERARSAIEKERESDVLRRSKEENAFDLGIYLERAKAENPHVHRMIELVKEHYDTKWGIEDAAVDIGVSASFLSRKFKAVTEHTYLDFINKYRIQQAVKLLGSGKLRIYEISDKVGFTDYKHFNSVFKRYTGQSPTEFKNHTEREG